ncbi:hypothetical protein [Bradyrhizobium sp.]|uniref:hypothetical protein n=1 Tax=Bradyrhizobium sp. TaxID=376 RepID=UPI003C4039BD
MNINASFVRKISAMARHRNDTHWLYITVHEQPPGMPETETEITLFIDHDDGARIANLYAEAINSVADTCSTDQEIV